YQLQVGPPVQTPACALAPRRTVWICRQGSVQVTGGVALTLRSLQQSTRACYLNWIDFCPYRRCSVPPVAPYLAGSLQPGRLTLQDVGCLEKPQRTRPSGRA